MKYIICHYGELSLKGKNRDFFEKQLIFNIKNTFKERLPGSINKISKLYGRLLIEISEEGLKNSEKIQNILQMIFGLSNFSLASKSELDIDIIKKECLKALKRETFETFRITARRSQKSFFLTSEELNREVGAYIVEKTNKKVNLKQAQANCFIEIVDNLAFIYTNKIRGAGGMPVGTSGKSLVLISGGLDSPVATYYALKRGLSVSFIHFHSVPYTSKESIRKIKRIISQLKNFGATGKIYLVPFAEIQKEIVSKCPEKLRVILYRRIMVKIAEETAKKAKVKSIVTGDSLAQVASQTIENITAVNLATELPIIRPLICLDKEEIMEKAKEIGTYETSIEPHDDCCTRLMPKNPETKAKIKEVVEAEKLLDLKKSIEIILKKVEVLNI